MKQVMDQINVVSLLEPGQAKFDEGFLRLTTNKFRHVLKRLACPPNEQKSVQGVTCAVRHATFIGGADFAAKDQLCIMVDAVGIILDGGSKVTETQYVQGT